MAYSGNYYKPHYSPPSSHRNDGRKNDFGTHSLRFAYGSDIYKSLGFPVKLTGINVDPSSMNYEEMTICGSIRDKENVQNEIDAFAGKMTTKVVKLTDKPGLLELILNEEGNVDYRLDSYLRRKLKGDYHLEFLEDDNDHTPTCIIRSLDQSVCDKISYRLERAFEKHSIYHDQLQLNPRLKEFIRKNESQRKLKVIDDQFNVVVIYCINKISRVLLDYIAEQAEVVPLSEHNFMFLERYGQILLQEITADLNLKASLDSSIRAVSLIGEFQEMDEFKHRLRTAVHKDCMTVPLSQWRDTQAVSHFDNITAINECTVSTCLLEQPVRNRLDGCDYFTTIYHPVHPGTVSCISGPVAQLKVDSVILLTTDRLFPLHTFSGQDKSLCTILDTEQNKAFSLWDCTYRQANGERFGGIIRLVTVYANTLAELPLTSCSTKALLDIIEKKNCKTVCLPVTDVHGTFPVEKIADTLVDALIKGRWEERDVHFYLCFDDTKLPLQEDIDDAIAKQYRHAKRGFSRKSYKSAMNFGIGSIRNEATACTIKLERGSLLDVKTDAIVNPTNGDLQLDKGYVSSSLLEAAGKDMQKHCNEKYPKGINQNGIAVSPPFGLKDRNANLKCVLHGALPPFDISSYQQHVKRLMRLCLRKAEENGCKTIAFPALGTGRHGNPIRETIKAMFEAIVEYRDESLAPALRTVVFAFPDDDSFRVFEKERSRIAHSGGFSSYPPEGSEYLEGTVTQNKNKAHILFVNEPHDYPVPSCTVDVTFSQDVGDCRFKYAFEEPHSDFDQLEVKYGGVFNNDDEMVKSAIMSCLEFCKKHRLTEINLIPMKVHKLTETDLYLAIANALLDFFKSNRDILYTHKVYIKLCKLGFEKVKGQLIGSKSSIFGSLFSSFIDRVSVDWQRCFGGPTSNKVHIQILGKTKESVCHVKTEISHKIKAYLQTKAVDLTRTELSGRNQAKTEESAELSGRNQARTEESYDTERLGARPKQSNASRPNQDHASQFDGSVSEQDQGSYDSDLGGMFRGIISAEINKGFLVFKDRFNDKERWLTKVREEFKLSIDELHGTWKVKGDFEKISVFKHYLDEYFPQDPSKPMLEDIIATVRQQTENTIIEGPKHSKDQEIWIKVERQEASALIALYTCKELNGVKTWEYDIEKRELHVTCQYNEECERGIEKDIRRTIKALHREDWCFNDPNDFMIVESNVADLNSRNGCYFAVVPQDSKITVYGRDRSCVRQGIAILKTHCKNEPFPEASILEDQDVEGFTIRNNSVLVKIYHGDITKLPLDAVAIPASRNINNIKGLQSVVMQAAGSAVLEEYKSLFNDGMYMRDGECKLTGPGNLKYKHLLHVYLPKYKTDRDRHIDQINMLENLIIDCFNAAEKECDKSIVLPFIGSGNAGFDIKICAQQYFRAVISKDWISNHLKEIHFVSNVDSQVQTVRRIFKECIENSKTDLQTDRSLSKETDGEDTFRVGHSGEVALYVTVGSVTAVKVDAIACRQNAYFTLNHGVIKEIYDLCGERGKKDLTAEGKRGMAHIERFVYEVSPGGSSLTCKEILYVVLPGTSKLTTEFEKLIAESVCLILDQANEKKYTSVAIPFLGEENWDKSVTQACCRSIVKGIFKHVYHCQTPVKEIHVLDRNLDIVQQFRRCVNYNKGKCTPRTELSGRNNGPVKL